MFVKVPVGVGSCWDQSPSRPGRAPWEWRFFAASLGAWKAAVMAPTSWSAGTIWHNSKIISLRNGSEAFFSVRELLFPLETHRIFAGQATLGRQAEHLRKTFLGSLEHDMPGTKKPHLEGGSETAAASWRTQRKVLSCFILYFYIQ